MLNARNLMAAMLLILPLTAWAQDDDMYFVPKKKAKKTKTEQVVTRPQRYVPVEIVYEDDYTDDDTVIVTGITRDVDEYNRRTPRTTQLTGELVQNPDGTFTYRVPASDTLYVVGDSTAITTEILATDLYSQGYEDGLADGEDYACSQRISRFGYGGVYASPWYYSYDPYYYDDWYWGRPYYGYYGYYGWHHPYWSVYAGLGWGPYWGGGYWGGGHRPRGGYSGRVGTGRGGHTGRSGGISRSGRGNGVVGGGRSGGAGNAGYRSTFGRGAQPGNTRVDNVSRGRSGATSISRGSTGSSSRSYTPSTTTSTPSRSSGFSSGRSGGSSGGYSGGGSFGGGGRSGGGGFGGGGGGRGGGRSGR